MPMTDAERQQKRRDKLAAEGLEQVQIWIQPSKKKQLLKYAELLRKLTIEENLLTK